MDIVLCHSPCLDRQVNEMVRIGRTEGEFLLNGKSGMAGRQRGGTGGDLRQEQVDSMCLPLVLWAFYYYLNMTRCRPEKVKTSIHSKNWKEHFNLWELIHKNIKTGAIVCQLFCFCSCTTQEIKKILPKCFFSFSFNALDLHKNIEGFCLL